MYAVSGILAALFERERTAVGAVIEVSLLDSMVEWMGYPFYYARYTGAAPPRTGARHATIAPYGPFTTRDSKTLLLSVQNEDEWETLCSRVLQRPALARDSRLSTNPLRVTNRALTDQVVGEGIRKLSLAEAIDLCNAARIACGEVNDVGTLEHHPQLKARHRWTDIDSPVGRLTSMLPPIIVRDQRPAMGNIPAVGEHSAAILQELGYSNDDIRRLREAGIV